MALISSIVILMSHNCLSSIIAILPTQHADRWMNMNLHLLDPLTCTTFTTMTMTMIMDCSSLQHQVLFMYAYHHSSTKYLHSPQCTKAISIYQWKGKRSKCASFKWPYIFTLVWYNYKMRIFQSIIFLFIKLATSAHSK